MPDWIKGLRTYILIVVGMIFNVLASMGIVLPDVLTEPNIIIVIDVVLAILTMITNFIGRKGAAASGKVMKY